MLLEGKSVIITGAGSGVGRAAALIFARNGAKIICADVVAERNNETVELVRAEGGAAQDVLCDVSDEAQVKAAVEAAVAAYGRLDVMFNNAGIATTIQGSATIGFADTTDADYDRLANVNFRGTVNGCRQAIRQFLAQGDNEGVIVNTASVAGLIGWGGAIYGGTKGAVIQLTRSLAIEYAKHGVRVNSVCPAGMATNFGIPLEAGYRQVSDKEKEIYGKLHPLGRPIDPEDVANAAMFLASDLAKNITGVAVPVDGGLVAA